MGKHLFLDSSFRKTEFCDSFDSFDSSVHYTPLEWPHFGTGVVLGKRGKGIGESLMILGPHLQSCMINPENIWDERNSFILNIISKANMTTLLAPLTISLESSSPLPSKYVKKMKDLDAQIPVLGLLLSLNQRDVLETGEGLQVRPLKWTIKNVEGISRKIELIQKQMGIPVFIENAADTFLYSLDSKEELSETQFINLILNRSRCYFSLDITNVYCNAWTEGQDPRQWIDQIELSQMASIKISHMNGHGDNSSVRNLREMSSGLEDGFPRPFWEFLEYVVQKICPAVVLMDMEDSFGIPRTERVQHLLERLWGRELRPHQSIH